jgi:hypothetical protein
MALYPRLLSSPHGLATLCLRVKALKDILKTCPLCCKIFLSALCKVASTGLNALIN